MNKPHAPQRRRSLRALNRILAATGIVACSAHAARAAVTWDGGGHNFSWSTRSNWNGNVEPGSGDDVILPAVVPDDIGTIELFAGELARTVTFNNNYDLTAGSLDIATGTVTAAQSTLSFIDSTLTGAVGLNKSGAGEVGVIGSNLFTGAVTILDGKLRITSDAGLGNAANAVKFRGGAVLDGASTLVVANTFSSARTYNLGTTADDDGAIDVSGSSTFTMTGAITGGGGLSTELIKAGTGTLVLANTSISSAIPVVTMTGGTIRLGASNVLPVGCQLGAGNSSTIFDFAGFNQTVASAGVGTMTNTSATGSTLTIAGAGSYQTIGTMSGNLAFVHSGSGDISLVAANTHTNGTTVNGGGGLVVGADDRLGAANVAVTLNNGKLSGSSFTLVRPLVIGVGGGTIEVGLLVNTLTATSAISGGGALTKTGAGTFILAGATASGHGPTTVAAGTLVLQKSSAGVAAVPGNVTVGDGVGADVLRLGQSEQIADGGILTIATSGTVDVSSFTETVGSVTMTGPAQVTGSGTGTLVIGTSGLTTSASAATATIASQVGLGGGSRTFTVPDGAAAVDLNVTGQIAGGNLFKAGTGLMQIKRVRGGVGSLNANQGTLRLADDGTDAGVSVADSAAHGGARIDVRNNTLVLLNSSLGSWGGAQYNGAHRLLETGYGNGTWDGLGIVTSMTDANLNRGLTAVGIAGAAEINRVGAVVGGATLDANDVLIAYTYAGDANLDRKLNGDDYFRVDFGFAQHLSGWANGDFNYDGRVNGDDYFVLDHNLGRQTSGVFPSSGAAAAGAVTAVPEPAAAVMLVTAGAVWPWRLRRRRRT